MVKLWFLISVATLEAYKSESGRETNCNKYKRNTIEVILEWILTTHTAANTPRISIITLSLLRIRAFFSNGPQCLLPYFSKMEKDIDKRFSPLKITSIGELKFGIYYKKSDKNRTNLRYWNVVANGKCTAETGELSSVKKLFWVNHAPKNARNSPN